MKSVFFSTILAALAASAQVDFKIPFTQSKVVLPAEVTLTAEVPTHLSPEQYRAAVSSECESFREQLAKLRTLPPDRIRSLAFEMRRLPIQGDLKNDFRANFVLPDQFAPAPQNYGQVQIRFSLLDKKPNLEFADDAAGVWYKSIGLDFVDTFTFIFDGRRTVLQLRGRDLFCDFVSGRLKVNQSVGAEISLHADAVSVRSRYLAKLDRLVGDVLARYENDRRRAVRLGLGLNRLFQEFDGFVSPDFLDADYVFDSIFEKDTLQPVGWYSQSKNLLNWRVRINHRLSIQGEKL